MGRKLLTRYEMWNAITSKYPSLKKLTIEGSYKNYSAYARRYMLFDIVIDMKIHKSRHLNKKQKQKVQYELNLKILNKI